MHYSEYRFTLDLQKHQSQQSIDVFKGDTAVRLRISLTDGGKPYKIGQGSYAVFFGKRADNVPLLHSCTFDENRTEIIYEFEGSTSFVSGVVDCQCRLYGADQKLITAPRFSIVVAEPIVDGEEEIEIPPSTLTAIDDIILNENNRVNAETGRSNAEATRVFNEGVREDNEQTRQDNENARMLADETRKEEHQAAIAEINEKCDSTLESLDEHADARLGELKEEVNKVSEEMGRYCIELGDTVNHAVFEMGETRGQAAMMQMLFTEALSELWQYKEVLTQEVEVNGETIYQKVIEVGKKYRIVPLDPIDEWEFNFHGHITLKASERYKGYDGLLWSIGGDKYTEYYDFRILEVTRNGNSYNILFEFYDHQVEQSIYIPSGQGLGTPFVDFTIDPDTCEVFEYHQIGEVKGLQGEKGEKGDPTDVVQETGDSETAVMSQKAVTDALFSKMEATDTKSGHYVDVTLGDYKFTGWNIVSFSAEPYVTYEYSGLTTLGGSPMSAFYNGDKAIEFFKQATGTNRITTPEGTTLLRFSVKDVDLESFVLRKANYADADKTSEKISQNAQSIAQHEKSITFISGDFSSILEVGFISADGTNNPWNARLRFSEIVKEPFSVTLNEGFEIFRICYYNKETDEFIRSDDVMDLRQTKFVSNGEYGIKLVIYKHGAENETIPEADISLVFKNINVALSETYRQIEQNAQTIAQHEKAISLATGNYSSILEVGLIGTDGTNNPWTARLRFSEIVKEPFAVYLTEDFSIFRICYYDKETDAFIRCEDKLGLQLREFISNGEYGVRLVIYKHGAENAVIPETDIPFVFKNVNLANSEKLAQNTCNYTSLKDLPDASKSVIAVIPDVSAGMIWSDTSVWRWAKNNELAVSARRYKTIKVSDGATMNEKDADTVEVVHSISKVLGAAMALRYVSNLTETVVIVESDIINASKDTLLQPGDVVTYETLLHSALIQSDNNAAESLSRLIGYRINPSASTDAEARSSYSIQAEAFARELGMTNTTDFRSPAWSLKSTATDLCKLYKHIVENMSAIMDIWGKQTYEMSVSGSNARTWTITSTTSSQDRVKVPEFVGGKTGSGDVEGCWGFVWRNPNDNELYITILLGYTLAKGNKAQDGRQIIDEVYSLS